MKPPTTAIASRPAVAALSLYSRPLAARRCYATHSNATTKPAGRRAVTPVHDDGHIPWSELSVKEKTGRVAEQTVNFGIIVLGVVLTGGVGYYLYQEVFSPDSKVAYYNRAVDRIRKDPRCLELLGQGNEIKAFGQETNSAWRRARPIASTLSSDGSGTEHLRIQFNVQGPKGTGTVNMHLMKKPGASDFEYRHFFVDVKGHGRIYLEGADAVSNKQPYQKVLKLFGVRWT